MLFRAVCFAVVFPLASMASWIPPENLGPTLNSEYFDGHPFLTADGLTLYYDSDMTGGQGDRDIWVSHVIGDTPQGPLWSAPANLGAPINTSHFDGHHCFTADGQTLYFVSDRPGGLGITDIWVSVWTGSSWGEPVNLGAPINSSAWEVSPFISSDGQTLYFCSGRTGGYGHQDIYCSQWLGDSWSEPENLGPTVNTSMGEYCPWVSTDNSALYFMSWGHENYGDSDLFVSHRTGTAWGAAENLGPFINTEYGESGPFLTPGMHTLYFHSSIPGGSGYFDLYVSYDEPGPWSDPVNLGPFINAGNFDGNACFTPDGNTLYFDSERSGGYGDRDVWISKLIGWWSGGPSWSPPVNAGPPLNSAYFDGHVTITGDGSTLYFISRRPGGYGYTDIWVSSWTGSSWDDPTNLGATINTSAWEVSPFISHDGRTLYFCSGRAGGYGHQDIYRSEWTGNGWSEPHNLGPGINTDQEENGPWIDPDEELLLFQSWGHGGQGQVDLFATVWTGSGWSEVMNIDPPVNSAYREGRACMTPDMSALYFHSDRPGGHGYFDLYVSFRQSRSDGVRVLIEHDFQSQRGKPFVLRPPERSDVSR
jgi:Tol biopolymer transport system component